MSHLFKRQYLISSVFLILLIFTFNSCKKDETKQEKFNNLSLNREFASISPYIFNWETSTYMPTSPANVVPMPWQGTVGGVNGNIVSDYKSADGWQLVYNTFSPTASPYLNQTPPGGLYFALYNQYRGLLRFYLYIPTGTATPTYCIAHGLSLYPSGSTSSSMLNFTTSDLIDVATNTSSVLKTNNQQVNLLGNWVAMQYEIAYDPNILNTTYPGLGLQWTASAVNITQISIDGTQSGTITGSINTPASGLGGLFGSVIGGGLEFFGLSDISSAQDGLPAGTQKSLLTNAASAVSSGLGNAFTGLFSAIFGGNSANSQSVNLNLSTQISLTGTATNSFGITNPFFVIPAQSNSTIANGPIPNYNNPLGVLNITSKPQLTVPYKVTVTPGGPHGVTTKTVEYFITKPDYSSLLVYNPSVVPTLASATIVKQDLIIIPNSPFTGLIGVDGTTEMVGTKQVYVNPTHLTFGASGPWQTAVRFTIKITPSNGAPASTIIKTFLVNETNTSEG